MVEDEVPRDGRVDDHDDLVEVAAVGSQEHEVLRLLLRRFFLDGCGSGRGRDLGAATVRHTV